MLRISAPTATKPALLQARPDLASQRGARLPVAAITQSAEMCAPFESRRPSGTPAASAKCSEIPRSDSSPSARRFTLSACPARKPSSGVTRAMRGCRKRLRKTVWTASASSTPAAPPPTTATWSVAASALVSRKRDQEFMKASTGRTDRSLSPNVARFDASISPPVASDRRSNSITSPLDSSRVRRSASRPITSARMSFAPARSASGLRSIRRSFAR